MFLFMNPPTWEVIPSLCSCQQLYIAEEKTKELEDIAVETIQNEAHRGKRLTNEKEYQWDNFR